MIVIVDYGAGNLFSLKSSLARLGIACTVSGDYKTVTGADGIILPGVGAFADAASDLRASGLDKAVVTAAKEGTPLLGICLGMQLLFDESLEDGRHKGLGLIPGTVVPLRGYVPDSLRVPQIGYNRLDIKTPGEGIYKYSLGDTYAYFVHSYYADTDKKYITASAEYGAEVTASVKLDNITGTQYHPEKSGSQGLAILKAFCDGVSI